MSGMRVIVMTVIVIICMHARVASRAARTTLCIRRIMIAQINVNENETTGRACV